MILIKYHHTTKSKDSRPLPSHDEKYFCSALNIMFVYNNRNSLKYHQNGYNKKLTQLKIIRKIIYINKFINFKSVKTEKYLMYIHIHYTGIAICIDIFICIHRRVVVTRIELRKGSFGYYP